MSKINLTMANINITRMSPKGQVVSPLDMWQGIAEGDKLIVLKNKNQVILKKADDFSKNIEEDLEFARRTEEAYKRVEAGEFVSVDSKDLFEEMDKW